MSDLPAGRQVSALKTYFSMFFVYVLFSLKNNRTYTGMTIDVVKRLGQHNLKQNKSTKAYVPWKLIHQEAFKTRIEARKR